MAFKDISRNLCLENISNTKRSAVEALENAFQNGFIPHNVEKCMEVSHRIIELVKDPFFLDAIKQFKDYSSPVHTHSFLVSVFAVITCQKLEWNTGRTISSIVIGGLLHNAGLSQLPPHLQILDPRDLSEEEEKLYKSHPERGMSILSDIPQISAAVQQIVFQHHELSGRGYPYELPVTKIYPPAKVVCLAERFASMLIKQDSLVVDGLPKFVMNREEVSQHEPDIVRAFVKSFIKEEKKA